MALSVLCGCTDEIAAENRSLVKARPSVVGRGDVSLGCFGDSVEYDLTESLPAARDVRWVKPDSLVLSSFTDGVFLADLRPDLELGSPILRSGKRRGELFLPAYLGASEEYVAVAAPVFYVAWKRWDQNRLNQRAFAAILDIDVQGDRLLILGAERDGEEFAPDGAIAWMGEMSDGLASLRPILFSSTGPGARAVDACGLMEIGNVRWLDDGSALVVPGVEGGVYLYRRDGALARTWQSDSLGFDAGCGLTDTEIYRYSADQPGRWKWVSQRRVVDDILPLPSGPGLLIRTVSDGVARWLLRILAGEQNRMCEIPIEGTSTSDLHADVIGDRVIFLLHSRRLPDDLQGDTVTLFSMRFLE